MNKETIKKTARGSFWLIGTNVASVFLRLASITILARILEPSHFGIFALLKLMYLVPTSVMSSHLTRNIILLQNKKGIFINSVYIAIFYATIISFLLYIFSTQIALLFDEPDLKNLIKSIFYLPLLLLLNSILDTYYTKQLKFKVIAIRNFIAMTFGAVFISILLSYLGYGVWALIYGFIASEVLKLMLLIVNIKNETYSFELNKIKLLYNNVVSISGTQLLNQSVNNIDKTIISKYFGATALGFYDKGSQASQLPINLIANPLQKVGFASLATEKNNLPFLGKSMLNLLNMTIKALLPLSLLMFSMSDLIIYILLGENWSESVPILQIMSFCMFFKFMFKIFTTFLATLERFDKIFHIQLVNIIVFIVFSLILSSWGINGIAVSLIFGLIIACLVGFYSLNKLLKISFIDIYNSFIKTIPITIVLITLVFSIEVLLKDHNYYKCTLQFIIIMPYLINNLFKIKTQIN